MHHIAFRTALGLSLVVGVATAAPPAIAAPDESVQQAAIKLGVVRQAGGPARTATLTCDPVGGTHPHAELACAELAKANGDIRQIPWRPGWGCIQIWDPVNATATGYWKGQPIRPYSEVLTNNACARIAHGYVLDF